MAKERDSSPQSPACGQYLDPHGCPVPLSGLPHTSSVSGNALWRWLAATEPPARRPPRDQAKTIEGPTRCAPETRCSGPDMQPSPTARQGHHDQERGPTPPALPSWPPQSAHVAAPVSVCFHGRVWIGRDSAATVLRGCPDGYDGRSPGIGAAHEDVNGYRTRHTAHDARPYRTRRVQPSPIAPNQLTGWCNPPNLMQGTQLR